MKGGVKREGRGRGRGRGDIGIEERTEGTMERGIKGGIVERIVG
jgi:hypothetical protein